VSSTSRVPETQLMGEDELAGDDAWEALRQYGRWNLLHDAFIRFRYGDGFSHSRALLASLMLAAYVKTSGAFDATYGALAGVMALLVWANLTGIALFLGLAFAAQLEAIRVGVTEPGLPDRWDPADRPVAPAAEAASSREASSEEAAD